MAVESLPAGPWSSLADGGAIVGGHIRRRRRRRGAYRQHVVRRTFDSHRPVEKSPLCQCSCTRYGGTPDNRDWSSARSCRP